MLAMIQKVNIVQSKWRGASRTCAQNDKHGDDDDDDISLGTEKFIERDK